jgi:hypothetical protein
MGGVGGVSETWEGVDCRDEGNGDEISEGLYEIF